MHAPTFRSKTGHLKRSLLAVAANMAACLPALGAKLKATSMGFTERGTKYSELCKRYYAARSDWAYGRYKSRYGNGWWWSWDCRSRRKPNWFEQRGEMFFSPRCLPKEKEACSDRRPAGANSSLGPPSCPYSPTFGEGAFSEVHLQDPG
jgi:hypothetical protein